MSVQPVTYYHVVCDVCGVSAQEGGEFTAWSDPDSAYLDTEESNEDWSTSPDGLLHRCLDHNPFCTKCGGDAGELSGERDYMCPACFAKEVSA